ncbi:hypothetical protein [Devosia sp.]|uniref:hypothetical protein n=1 Tax=Devosia sp. TaxID=1871048 RepID=UPI002EE79AE2
MDTDLATSLTMARATATQFSAQVAVIKKAHEMDLALLRTLEDTARPAPPPGQGGNVDKTA